MQINNCIVSKPGIFNNKTVELFETISVIYGKNDTGKSLLARAIIDVIWGYTSNNTLLNSRTWEDLYLNIEITNMSTRYRFTKNGEKNYTLKLLEENKEISLLNKDLKSENADINNSFSELLSTPPGERLFNSLLKKDLISILTTSFLPSPADLNREEILNYDACKRLFLEDNSNFFSIYNNIKLAFDQEKISNRFNSIILNEILNSESKIRDLDKEIQLIDIKNSKTEKLKKEKGLIEKEIRNFTRELSSLRNRKSVMIKIQENIDKIEDINGKMEKLKDEIENENERKNLIAEIISEIDSNFPKFKDFNETQKQNLKKIQEIYKEFRNINEKIENFNYGHNKKRKVFRSIVISIFISSSIAILLSIYNIIIKISENEKHYLILGLLILSLSSMLILAIFYVFGNRSRELGSLIKEKSTVEEKLKKIFLENKIILNDFKLESMYEFLLQYFGEYGEYTEKKLEMFTIKEQMKDDAYLQNIKRESNELENYGEKINSLIKIDLQSIGEKNYIDLEHSKIDSMISQINRNIKQIKGKIKNKEAIRKSISDDIIQHSSQEQEREQFNEKKLLLSKKLNHLNTHKDAMKYILDLFSEAIESREKKQLIKLLDSAKEKFNFLTNNQYISSIDNECIKSLITNNEVRDEFNPTTAHLMYLSIKIAITDFLIDSGTSFPLIIDEPFIFMDDIRAEKFRELLNDVSRYRQVIILTHNKSFKNWGCYIEL